MAKITIYASLTAKGIKYGARRKKGIMGGMEHLSYYALGQNKRKYYFGGLGPRSVIERFDTPSEALDAVRVVAGTEAAIEWSMS